MDRLIISGGKPLEGKVIVSGAKNAALPIMTSALLARGEHNFSNIPDLRDVRTMMILLEHLGLKCFLNDGNLKIINEKIKSQDALYELVKTMRASVLVLGPLVAATGFAKVSLPGGCAIGARPINLHIKALESMGAEIEIENGYVVARANKLKGTHISFDKITVTGTSNVMMSAVFAEGETIIENAACEPEVSDLANYLNKMGAKISGIGTNRLVVEGVNSLTASEHRIISDRIEAGTFAFALAATTGHIKIENINPDFLESVISHLKEAGAEIQIGSNYIDLKFSNRPTSVDTTTAPYPGFATDLQAQIMASMCVAKGTSVIKETIFENRFMHVPELIRLGADIRIEGNTAIVKGVDKLFGAPLMATDLRASASLVIAGLSAIGDSVVDRIYHLDRGYEKMDEKLSKLGANIKRIKSS